MFAPEKPSASNRPWLDLLNVAMRRFSHATRRRRRKTSRNLATALERLEDRSLLSTIPGDLGGTGFVVNTSGYLTDFSDHEPGEIARNYLASNYFDLGLTSSDVSNLVITRLYQTTQTGATHITFKQSHNGIPVFGSDLNFTVARDGRLVTVGNRAVDNLVSRIAADRPSISALQAINITADSLGITPDGSLTARSTQGGMQQEAVYSGGGISRDDIPIELQYRLGSDGNVHLTWNVVIRPTNSIRDWLNMFVDSQSGSLLPSINWAADANPNGVPNSGTYNVFDPPTTDPDDGPRTLVVNPADTTASPFGWHDTNGQAGPEFTDTRGNNVFAEEDLAGNLGGSPGARPNGGPTLTFNFPVNPTANPTTFTPFATTNLFYLNNIAHDLHYAYGFDEAAGNFQVNNYGRGGIGGDQVQAFSQVFGNLGALNNAFMATPPDGFNPLMVMGLFQIRPSDPLRDSDLSSDVVIHEHGHGVSNRLTGDASGLFALQSGGMGEGWSDWWGMMFAQRPTDAQNDRFPAGNYVLNFPPTGPGIRNFPYSFDKTINPLTYGNYDDLIFPSAPNALPLITGNPGFEVHNAGEIWASALWDLNWLLINKHGYDSNLYTGYSATAPVGSPQAAGNKLALQLVMDGLKIQPINPSFLDARDAILAADVILTGGQNQFEIWSAFARRGMGLSADDGGSANDIDITEAFDVPFTVIQGAKFNDVNGNGLRAGINEVGLSGWTIYVDQNQNGVRDQSTATFAAVGVPQDIRDTTTVNSTITVSGMAGFVLDVNVTLDITHPYDADMDVFLISPSGLKAELFTDIGANLANFTNTTLDDSAATSIALGRAPFTGTFRPEGRLSDVNGDNPNGVWTLQVIDDAPRDVGRLNSWSMQLTAGENNVKTDLGGNYSLIVPGGGTYTVAEELQLGWAQTAPAAPGVFTVTLNTFTVAPGQDFGNQTSTNANPVVVLPTAVSTYLENGPALRINPNGLVTDADSANFNGGTLIASILVNGTADDRLEITNQGTSTGLIGISGSNVTFGGAVIGTFTGGNGANPLVVTFNANATAPLITALLRQITFRVVSDSPSEQARTASVQVTDGSGGPATVAVTTINVVAENDRPVNTVPTGTITVLRNVALQFTGTDAISIADVDVLNSAMLVTLTATNGTLSLSSTTGLTFVIGDGIADATLSFTGLLADVNAALAGLSYTSNAGYVGPATVTITSSDQGATGAGGVQTDSDTINLAVGNQPPTLTSVGLLNGAIEDTDFTISHSALSLVADDTDPNFDPITFRIESVSSGTLTKNGVAVTPQITTLGPGESLVWRAAANANGELNAFTMRATDGMFFTDPPVQVTVGVAAVADTPTLTIVNPLSKAAASFPFSISYDQLSAAADEMDVDNDTLVFRVEAVTRVDGVPTGTLTKNGSDVVPGTTTLAAGESLVWTPNAGAKGTIDAFTVTAVDPSNLASSPAANVSVVTVISTPPTMKSVGTLFSAQRNGIINITHDLLKNEANDFDPEGDTLTFRIEELLSGAVSKNGASVVPGVTTLGPGETLVYTPIVGTVNEVEAFKVTATDGVFFTSPSVTVKVNVVNTAPSLSIISTLTEASEDVPFTITQPTVAALSDDADFDNDTVNYVITSVLNGTLTQNGLPIVPGVTVLDAANAVAWTPALNANGVLDAFTVRAFDGNLLSTNTTTVKVNVAPVNDAPTLTFVTNVINGIETLPFDFTHQILTDAADEADVDNVTISFRVESMISGTLLKNGVQVVPGQTSIGPGEKFVWIPPQGAIGTVAAFTVTAFDGSLASSTPITVALDMSPLGLTRMYRSYNPAADYHFFTLSTGEFTAAVRHGYQDETAGRPGFAVPLLNLFRTSAIHRLRNPYNGRHYYTGNSAERDFLRRVGWVYEKDEGNIFNQQVAGSVEVFRLYNNLTGTHLFTENAATKNAVLAQFPGIWVQHASLGYAFPLPPANTSSSSNPISAGARSGAAPSNGGFASQAPASAGASSASNSITDSQSSINAGLIAQSLTSTAPSIPLHDASTGDDDAFESTKLGATQSASTATDVHDRVWVEIGEELSLGTNLLIDRDD